MSEQVKGAEQRSLFDAPVATEAKRKRVPTPDDDWDGVGDLFSLRELVLPCHRCSLREGAQRVVFGQGSPQASVMLVGEGPGQTEDDTGQCFVGRAGQMLDRGLEVAGLDRDDVYISNIVKCRPPGNRLPTAREVKACLPHLRAQIRLLNPDCIVLLGALSAQTLLSPSLRVTRDRGKWYRKDGREYLVTFHPAAVLRDSPGRTEPFLDDFRRLGQRLKRAKDG